jgi:hypothetical protein
MKFATFALLGILLLGSFASMNAAGPAGSSQVVLAFSGGGVFTSDTTGICMWYPVLLGDLDLKSLFMGPMFGAPSVDKEHAYFIWVSDFSMQVLPPNKDFKDFNFLALVPAGTGTIYYSDRPDLRDWRDWSNRSTWGEPVATFVRQAGLFYSADDGMTGPMTSTAVLVSSTTFNLHGKPFNFKDLMPHGMTCFEAGVGAAEAGTCIAIGGAQ